MSESPLQMTPSQSKMNTSTSFKSSSDGSDSFGTLAILRVDDDLLVAVVVLVVGIVVARETNAGGADVERGMPPMPPLPRGANAAAAAGSNDAAARGSFMVLAEETRRIDGRAR